MKNQKTIGFPTQGELVQFVYSAAGILPRKRGLKDEMDEKTKKSLQKSLSRLASEEGDMNDNFGELVRHLSYLITGHISNQKVIFSIGEVLFDVLDVYKAVLRDEGTYLDKNETMKWFISNYTIPRVVLSVNKHLLRFNVEADHLLTPENDWFLPSIQDCRVEYPLAKTMRWAYELCEISAKSFHYPDKSPFAEFERQEQNLDSAENWLNGKGLPSLPVLLSNFNFSFDILEKCEDPKSRRLVSEEKRESIRVALFLARTSTFIFKKIVENYGHEFLADVCHEYHRYSSYLLEEIAPIKADIQASVLSQQLSHSQIDELWFDRIPEYFSCFDDKQRHFVYELQHHISNNKRINLNSDLVCELVKQYGNWTVMPVIDNLNRSFSQIIPEGFAEFLLRGLKLKDDSATTIEQVERFNIELIQSGVAIFLPWISDWIRGVFYYRKEQYEIAFPFFKKAFDAAKYCAGKNQYKLVNQFLEVAAKNDKWFEFKKGIEWSQYIGIEIRWLRENEPTQENLKFVFEMMKKARYGAM